MKTKLLEDLKEAMKQKDEIRKNTIQSIRSSILQEEKDKQIELDNNGIENIIVREKKKRIDSLEQFKKANRDELVKQTQYELEVINTYLPKQLSSEEIEQEVDNTIKELNVASIKEMGKVIKTLKEKYGASIDGKMLSDIVKQKLN